MPFNTLIPSEDDTQQAFIAYCRVQRDERRMALHIPNEGKRSQLGHIMAVKKGLLPGASDNFIPAPRAGWHGLWLELKRKGQKPTADQLAFGRDMEACGYRFHWADTLDRAITLTDAYMAGRDPRPNWVHYSAPVKT